MILASLFVFQLQAQAGEESFRQVAQLKSYSVPLLAKADLLNEASSLEEQAEQLVAKGSFAQAVDLLERALRIEEGDNGDNRRVAKCLSALANAYWALSQLSKAEELAAKAVALDEAAGSIDSVAAEHVELLGAIYFAQNSLEKAEEQYKKVLYIKEEKLGQKVLELYVDINHLILTYELEKKYSKAERLYDLLVSAWEKDGLQQHPQARELLIRYAAVLKEMGKMKESEAMQARANKLTETMKIKGK